jgi:hypothetical protein
VNEAATLIIEDISRNQPDINKNQSMKNTIDEKTVLPLSPSIKTTRRRTNRKPEGTPSSINKERMKSEREFLRSTKNSNQSNSKTRLAEPKDIIIAKKKSKSSKSSSTSHRSSKNGNKNQKNRFTNQM